jgi:hypothetical protein
VLGSGEEKGRRRKEGSVESALPRQAGWRGKAVAPVHVARQARAHLLLARRASPAWHPCCAGACGAAKGCVSRHAAKRGQRGHRVQIMFSRG